MPKANDLAARLALPYQAEARGFKLRCYQTTSSLTMADRIASHREGAGEQRSRSASPRRQSHSHRTRSRSPRRHHKKRRHEPTVDAVLPYNSRPLKKHDYTQYRQMFAQYLDIQKNKILADLSDTEVKGRWKSFMGKW